MLPEIKRPTGAMAALAMSNAADRVAAIRKKLA
jgi:hypothetical protein